MVSKAKEETEVAENAVPDYLKKYQNEDSGAAQSLSDSSTSIPRISLKGKKFRLIEGGEEIQKPVNELEVIIFDVQPEGRLMTKSFYDGQYNPSDTSPPDCSSTDGVHPDLWVSAPQASDCATCPKNVFGSATSQATGKRAKACKDSKRMWVALPDDVKGTVFALNIPVTSLKNAAAYGKKTADEGFPLFAVKTKLTMDDDSDFPVLIFESVGFLDEENGVAAHGRTQKHEWRSAPTEPRALPAAGTQAAIPQGDQANEAVAGQVVENKPTDDQSVDDVTKTW